MAATERHPGPLPDWLDPTTGGPVGRLIDGGSAFDAVTSAGGLASLIRRAQSRGVRVFRARASRLNLPGGRAPLYLAFAGAAEPGRSAGEETSRLLTTLLGEPDATLAAALADRLSAAASRQPLLLIVDEAQHCTQPERDLLVELCARLAAEPARIRVLLIAPGPIRIARTNRADRADRTDRTDRAAGTSRSGLIRVAGPSTAAPVVADLVARLCRAEPTAAVVEVLEQAAGAGISVTALIRCWLRNGTLRVLDRHTCLSSDREVVVPLDDPLSPTAELSHRARSVLDLLALAGSVPTERTEPWLAGLIGQPPDAIEAARTELVDAGLIVDGPALTSVRSELVAGSARAALGPFRRMTGHAALADALLTSAGRIELGGERDYIRHLNGASPLMSPPSVEARLDEILSQPSGLGLAADCYLVSQTTGGSTRPVSDAVLDELARTGRWLELIRLAEPTGSGQRGGIRHLSALAHEHRYSELLALSGPNPDGNSKIESTSRWPSASVLQCYGQLMLTSTEDNRLDQVPITGPADAVLVQRGLALAALRSGRAVRAAALADQAETLALRLAEPALDWSRPVGRLVALAAGERPEPGGFDHRSGPPAAPVIERILIDLADGRWSAGLASATQLAEQWDRDPVGAGTIPIGLHPLGWRLLCAQIAMVWWSRGVYTLAARWLGRLGPDDPLRRSAASFLARMTGDLDAAAGLLPETVVGFGAESLLLGRVEIALAQGDIPVARQAVSQLDELAGLGGRSAALITQHAHALVDRDRSAAGAAIDLARTGRRPGELGAALLLGAGLGIDPEASLNEALDLYVDLGASLDQCRTLAAMRRAKVSPARRRDGRTIDPTRDVVIRLISSGLSNRQVAHVLDGPEKAVEAVLSQIYDQTGFRSRTELAAAYHRRSIRAETAVA